MRLANKWQYAVVIAASAVAFAWLQAAPTFPDPDSYYHAAMAQQWLQHGVVYAFPWLPFTTLASAFTDHHLLYHLLSLPFVIWCGPVVGVKVAQALCGVVLATWLFYMLKRWQLPYALPAMLVLFTCYPFLVRINLVKASAIAVLLLLIIIWNLLHERWAWAGATTLIYSWVHGGFLLAVVVAILLWASSTLAKWMNEQRISWANPIGIYITIAASVLGVFTSPYFPHNLPFLWAQFFQIGVVNYKDVIQVGAEWYPFSITDLLTFLSVIWICVAIALAILLVEHKRQLLNATTISLWSLSMVFLILTMRSRRFVEYLVPVLWLFACYVLLPNAKRWWQQWKSQFGNWWWVLVGYIAITSLFALITTLVDTSALFYNERPIQSWQQLGEELQQRVPTGSTVFHAMWHQFPQLMWGSPNHAYIVGLDPTFLYLADPTKYQQWDAISRGKLKSTSAQAIREQFQAHYVVIDRTEERTKLLYAYLLRDDSVRILYDQGDFILFAL